MGPTCFGIFFRQEYGKNSAAAKKNSVFFKSIKTYFTVLKDTSFFFAILVKNLDYIDIFLTR